jgi:hypothetical protein
MVGEKLSATHAAIVEGFARWWRIVPQPVLKGSPRPPEALGDLV